MNEYKLEEYAGIKYVPVKDYIITKVFNGINNVGNKGLMVQYYYSLEELIKMQRNNENYNPSAFNTIRRKMDLGMGDIREIAKLLGNKID